MICLPSLIAFVRPLLRLALIVLIVLGLNVPHSGMTAMAQSVGMAMDHGSHSQNHPMDEAHGGSHHGGINGGLCAMVCVGADRVASFDPTARFETCFRANWDLAVSVIWRSIPLGPAQRPPDPARNL